MAYTAVLKQKIHAALWFIQLLNLRCSLRITGFGFHVFFAAINLTQIGDVDLFSVTMSDFRHYWTCHICKIWGVSAPTCSRWFLSHGFFTLNMEAIRSSETSIHTKSTRRHISEDGILHCHIWFPKFRWNLEFDIACLHPNSWAYIILILPIQYDLHVIWIWI
jgi:hypothetical protein